MKVQQFGKLYTQGSGEAAKAVSYNLEELNLIDCLVRVNKVSENGVALTVVTTLSSDFESQVSKAGLEKGQAPIKKSKGDVLVFDCNVSVKDDRKPDEVNGRCQTLINGLKGSMTKEGKLIALSDKSVLDGQVIRLTWDGASVPLKGIQRVSSLKEYLSDKEESVLFWELAEDCTDESSEDTKAQFEALNGSKWVEKQGYQKGKSCDQLFMERLDFAHKIVTTRDSEIMDKLQAVTGEFPVWDEDSSSFTYESGGSIDSIILGLLRV